MKRKAALMMAVVLALPTAGAPEMAAARGQPQWHKFCKNGVKDNHDLARRLADARKADPTGHAKLERCEANVLKFVAAFQRAAPEEHVTIENVAEFAENDTKMVQLEEDITFYSSCVKGESPEADDVVMTCGRPQTLKKGTWVIASIKTGKKLVKLDCGNVGFTDVAPPQCALIVYEVGDTRIDETHSPVWGPLVYDARCHGIARVKKGADGNWQVVGTPRDLEEGCIEEDSVCSYEDADRKAAPSRRTFDGHISGLTPGFWAQIVPDSFSRNPVNKYGICEKIVYEDGTWETSMTAIVRSIDYSTTPNGQRVAHPFYTEREMIAAGHKENDPGGLYLWPGE